MSLRDDSLYHHILDQCPLHQLVHEASDQICLVLEESRGYVENLIIKFKEKVLFKHKITILKGLSYTIDEQIRYASHLYGIIKKLLLDNLGSFRIYYISLRWAWRKREIYEICHWELWYINTEE